MLLEGGVLQGADWDREGGALVVGQGGGRLPALKGVPGDQREMALAKVTERAMVDTDTHSCFIVVQVPRLALLTLKLLRDRSKFKIKYCFPFLSEQ